VKHFKESNLAIVGTARNVSKYLHRIYRALSEATINFNSRTFFIVESYSTDSTVDVLESLSKNDRGFLYTSLQELESPLPPLSIRISQARNAAADMAREYDGYFDYVLVADLDNVNRDITASRLESCWKYQNWDMMSANQPFAYYDTWAFRHRILSPGDCWRDYDSLVEYFGKDEALKLAVRNRVLKIPPHAKPIPVDSAFGGLAVYRSKPYLKHRYSGVDKHGKEICEHVELHRELINDGCSLFINPMMINLNPARQGITNFVTNLLKKP
jgi:hypothetical protein